MRWPRILRFAKTKAPEIGDELTGRQLLATTVDRDKLSRPSGSLYATYRAMRKQPTIAMVRAFVRAPIMSAEWSFESNDEAPDGAADFLRKQLACLRQHVIKHAMNGSCDFGWAPFELVWGSEHEDGTGMVTIRKVKPLLQDLTEILILPETGAFNGLRQKQRDYYAEVDLEPERCLLFCPEVEGTNWYGHPLLENARAAYEQWVDANEGAARYDRKLAGSHWVLYYPRGRSDYNGTRNVDNSEIAAAILSSLESTGSIYIPRSVRRELDRMNAANDDESDWKIEALEDKTPRQPSFIDRLRYLDTLLARALLMPERTALEGQLGTRAEAETHADLSLTQRQLDHEYICEVLNWHLVNRLLSWNYGDEYRGTVWIKPAPLADAKMTLFRDIYTAVLTNPASAIEELGRMDLDAMREALGIPARPESDIEAEGIDADGEMADAMRTLYEAANGAADETETGVEAA